jgi:hypothetical protein
MAAPNLRSPATVTGKTAAAALTTTLEAVLSNANASGRALKVNTIRAANIGTASVTVDLALQRGATTSYLLKGGTLDAGKALIVADKSEYIYLEEGDVLQARASADSAVDVTINYEEIS